MDRLNPILKCYLEDCKLFPVNEKFAQNIRIYLRYPNSEKLLNSELGIKSDRATHRSVNYVQKISYQMDRVFSRLLVRASLVITDVAHKMQCNKTNLFSPMTDLWRALRRFAPLKTLKNSVKSMKIQNF